ncbi:aldehyde dehydrogenase family protein, partial [Corynebacterium diphtheriae]
VLLGVMPWNFPYYQIARFAAPNLMLGNAIVLKHPPPAIALQDPSTDQVVETFPALADGESTSCWPPPRPPSVRGARPIEERAAIVQKVADLFEERKDELAQIIATEMGKRVTEGVEEAEFSSAIFGYFADKGPTLAADRPIETFEGGRAMIRHLPLGVLLGVMPWNFPYYQIARFAAPNLMLGNAIVLKH